LELNLNLIKEEFSLTRCFGEMVQKRTTMQFVLHLFSNQVSRPDDKLASGDIFLLSLLLSGICDAAAAARHHKTALIFIFF
jgi:hypothetical protein